MQLLKNARRTSRIGSAVLAGAVLAAATPAVSAQQVEVDPRLPEYQKVSGVSGNIKSIGSDTMNNTMTLWAEGFLEIYPNVQIEIEGKGSSTAPPALISGTSNFGPMSREMKAEEIDEFESRYGYKPSPVRTCIDALAVFVHKDNPIAKQGLTLQQIDAIFSKTRRGGLDGNIRTWGDVGLTGEWANKPISLYGRNSASGTYGYFKGNALFGGDFKDSVKEQPGSSSVVQGVASDKYAIGYSGIGYKTADVATVPLAVDANSKKYDANAENAYAGDYPLARFLRVYVNHKPGSDLDPLRREFLKYMFSKKGQSDVIKDGYYPVSAEIAEQDLRRFGVTDYVQTEE
ncbi:MAG: PstS family phosphate ABC transporter substrate-binding protein [bacterium]